MDLSAPKAFTDLLPNALQPYSIYILGGLIGFGALIVLILLAGLLRILFRGTKKPIKEPSLEEDLTEYPDLKKASGDRMLRAEGVPVRIRLVVVAPAGKASEVDIDEIPDLFEKLIPGLGEIYKHDKPRVKEWPTQISYQGFATHFHRSMLTGAEEGEQTRWVLVAGRIKIGKKQVMLGMALQSIKPNTIGRRTFESHEWASALRVRVKD